MAYPGLNLCKKALVAVMAVVGVGSGLPAAPVLPVGSAPEPVKLTHFPDAVHAFVWRNWELVDEPRLARVLGATPEAVRDIARAMGLPKQVPITDQQRRRSYITLIRRNWQLVPYDQLLALLDWNADQLAYTLREDDFLYIKLGRLKPKCPPLRYAPPSEAARKRCAQIKAIVVSHFGDELAKPAQPRFAFVGDLAIAEKRQSPTRPSTKDQPTRFLYSYFAVYGDPLLHPELDPYPDGLLQRLADRGVNGIWLHVVLRQLAPSADFPEFGVGHEARLANLARILQRAKRHGIRVYLYMNEPRAMPAAFFESRMDLRGVQEGDHYAMCTSAPRVRRWITDALAYVFEKVPELGGVFTITASENLTNCASHGRHAECPRCKSRSGPEIIAEVNGAIETGVHRSNPEAKVIVWDWGWQNPWVESIINALPSNVYLMSVSEWDKPIVRGGVASRVGEYSISAVGPGPRAQRHWSWARRRGLKTIAKVQVNCTWELSAVPYLPVMDLVGQHAANLTETGVDGLMLSWTLGGYPSPNLQLVEMFLGGQTRPTVAEVLSRLAVDRYGPAAAGYGQRAWSEFSTAFAEFPFHIQTLYRGPMQYGPANLLYPDPTGYRSTMVGFPYDDVDGWRGVYPADVFACQFEKVADGWRKGLTSLTRALTATTEAGHQTNVRNDLRVAEAAYIHFKSVANQVRFTLARNALASDALDPGQRETHLAVIKAAATEEIQLAKRLLKLTREDSRIGFEASNHYYYLPLDLVEKVINCTYVLDDWLGSLSGPK